MESVIVDSAKVMSKGQVTIPKGIRNKLQVENGDRLTFIYKDNAVIVMNSALYAMNILQNRMNGKAKAAGLESEQSISELVYGIRKEIENQ